MKKILIGGIIAIVVVMAGLWLYIPTAVNKAVQKSISKLQAKGYEITTSTTVKRDGFVLYPTVTFKGITLTTPNKTATITLSDMEVHMQGVLDVTVTLDGHNGTTTAPVVKRIGSATFASVDAMVKLDMMALLMGTNVAPLSHIEGMIEDIKFANRAYGQMGLQDIRLSAILYGKKLPVLERLGAQGEKSADSLANHWAKGGGYIAVQSLAFNGRPSDDTPQPESTKTETTKPETILSMRAHYNGRVWLQNPVAGDVSSGLPDRLSSRLSTRGMVEASPFSSFLDILVKWKKIPKKVIPYTDLVMLLLGGQVQGDILTISLSFDEGALRVGKLEF